MISSVLLLAIVFLPENVNRPPSFNQASLAKTNGQNFVLGPSVKITSPPDFYLVQKNSFKGVPIAMAISPQVLASLAGDEEEAGLRTGIVEYVVQEGDTLSSIAGQFNISLETILWANNLSSTTVLTLGKKLVILPVSGVMYSVHSGDTLGGIVQKYKGDLQETIAFNELQDENDIFVGDIVIVPGGKLPPPQVKQPTVILAPLASGFFICPIAAPCRVTQRLHWYNAIDFSHGQCSEPIFAAAAGKVQKVKLTTSRSRWAFGGAGNHLTILHPNGVVTFYGHLLSAAVLPGQEVFQGQIIGYVGGGKGMEGAGKSTGCHLHFGVTGARNPFAP